MSKMSELSQVLDEMIACGEGMIKAANAMGQCRDILVVQIVALGEILTTV